MTYSKRLAMTTTGAVATTMILRTQTSPASSLLSKLVIALGLLIALPTMALAVETPDWMQAGAQKNNTVYTKLKYQPDVNKVIGTKIPKRTSKASLYKKRYTLELDKFGISKIGTDAVATSKGLNAALQEAKIKKANYIIFPKGTYLISHKHPIIFDHKDTIIDLNGAIIQMETNSSAKCQIAHIVPGAENFRLTNGTFRGDRDTHDYKTVKASHEHAVGLEIRGGKNMEIDNITVSNFPGYGIATRNGVGFANKHNSWRWIAAKHLQLGDFDSRGKTKASKTTLRTIEPSDISKCRGVFEFGYTFGYQGYPGVLSREFTSYFYDENMRFVKKLPMLQFIKTEIPEKAKFVHFVFNQSTIKNGSEGYIGRITDLPFSSDVHFHNNLVTGNRALGIAFCGGQRWILENNRFEENGPQAPGYGVDFEDGWDLMSDIIFRKNTFKGNKRGDLVVCAGTEMRFEDNVFERNIIFWDRVQNYVVQNNTINGGFATYKTGISQGFIRNNTYKSTRLTMEWNVAKRPNVPIIWFEKETFENMVDINGRVMSFLGCKFKNSTIRASNKAEYIHFKDCDLTNVSLKFDKNGPQVVVKIENCKGKLNYTGPGMSRMSTKMVSLK